MLSADRPATRLATRLAFFVAGFAIACWAPLIPLAKGRLAVDDAVLGLLLLCLGIGSITAMTLTGPLNARYGSRPVILIAGTGLALILPTLTLAATPVTLGIALLVFGATLGSTEVAMNVHATEVERASGRPLMSGFHAFFSIGGFAGSLLMTFCLSNGIGAFRGTLIASLLILAAIGLSGPRLLRAKAGGEEPLFVRPKGIVLLLAALTAVSFLAEGAVLDWGALLITSQNLVSRDQGGLGYIVFASAMTGARLVGDLVVKRVGDRAVLIGGGVLAVVGFAVLLVAPTAATALFGFLLIGLGASNVVPAFYRLAGTQTVMMPALAVGAITTAGYAGILVGPAAIGVVAKAVGLPNAFWMVAALLASVPLAAPIVAKRRTSPTGPTGLQTPQMPMS